MTAEPDLFTHKAAESIDALEVTFTERTVRDFWIVIGDRKFDAHDIYETLQRSCDLCDSYISDQRMVDALKALGVIKHGGSGRWAMSAEKGPNYGQFMAMLRRQLEKLGDDML